MDIVLYASLFFSIFVIIVIFIGIFLDIGDKKRQKERIITEMASRIYEIKIQMFQNEINHNSLVLILKAIQENFNERMDTILKGPSKKK